MDQKEDRSQLLEATLQEKESQLEQLTELQKVRTAAAAPSGPKITNFGRQHVSVKGLRALTV